MAKASQSEDIRSREAKQIRAALDRINKTLAKDERLTQEALANELGVTQGLVNQWFTGKTRIPDLTMLKLGERLNFDAMSVRPELNEYRRFFCQDQLLEGLSTEDQAKLKAVIHAFKESTITTNKKKTQ